MSPKNSLFACSGFRPSLSLMTLLIFLSTGGTGIIANEPTMPPVLLQMARDPAIHTELKLTAAQTNSVLAATDRVDPRWWVSRLLPLDQQQKVHRELTNELRTALVPILDEKQRERLRQLERQALGTRMLLTTEVADLLKLESGTRERIRAFALDTDRKVSELEKKMASGGNEQEINRELTQIRDRERKGIVDSLAPSQQRNLAEIVGQPFDFSRVTRSNPRAPELVGSANDWLQGGPVKLSQLRGKVVLVHFYAFQCINCQRNLPHYNGWFKDFPREDVVVIGIQTPETATERDPAQVKAAFAEQAIQYPVLFDPELANWNAWGNTMWPTVYLVDKEGFIRSWWQGELNWQGGNGEERFRQVIRAVIDET